MKKNVFKYAFLGFSSLILVLSIWWLVMHFQKPNLQSGELRRNLYRDWFYKIEDNTKIERSYQSEIELNISEGKRILFKYVKHKDVAKLIKKGEIKIIDNSGQVVYHLDMAEGDFSKEMKLPAGKYQVQKNVELNEEAVQEFENKTESDRKLLKNSSYGEYEFGVYSF